MTATDLYHWTADLQWPDTQPSARLAGWGMDNEAADRCADALEFADRIDAVVATGIGRDLAPLFAGAA